MKQVHANYAFDATTKTITLTGLNISQEKLLLVTNTTRGTIYYNFTSGPRPTITPGANTTIVLPAGIDTTGHADTDKLLIHYEDGKQPSLGPFNALSTHVLSTPFEIGYPMDNAATSDAGTFSVVALLKRLLTKTQSFFSPESTSVSLAFPNNQDSEIFSLTGSVDQVFEVKCSFPGATYRISAMLQTSATTFIPQPLNNTATAYTIEPFNDATASVSLSTPQNFYLKLKETGANTQNITAFFKAFIVSGPSFSSTAAITIRKVNIPYFGWPAQSVRNIDLGYPADSVATSDTGSFTVISLLKRFLKKTSDSYRISYIKKVLRFPFGGQLGSDAYRLEPGSIGIAIRIKNVSGSFSARPTWVNEATSVSFDAVWEYPDGSTGSGNLTENDKNKLLFIRWDPLKSIPVNSGLISFLQPAKFLLWDYSGASTGSFECEVYEITDKTATISGPISLQQKSLVGSIDILSSEGTSWSPKYVELPLSDLSPDRFVAVRASRMVLSSPDVNGLPNTVLRLRDTISGTPVVTLTSLSTGLPATTITGNDWYIFRYRNPINLEYVSGSAVTAKVSFYDVQNILDASKVQPLSVTGAVTANVGNPSDIIGGGYASLFALLDDFAPNVTINGAPVVNGTLPISGTVTANVENLPLRDWDDVIDSGKIVPVKISQVGEEPVPISGTVTANVAGDLNGAIETVNDVSNVSHAVAVHIYDDNGSSVGVPNNPLPISGTVTANVDTNSLIDALSAFSNSDTPLPVSGTVTADGRSDIYDGSNDIYIYRSAPHVDNGSGEFSPVGVNNPLPISGTVTVGNLPIAYNDTSDTLEQGFGIAWYESNSDKRWIAGENHPLPVSLSSAGLPAISGTVQLTNANQTVPSGETNPFFVRSLPIVGGVNTYLQTTSGTSNTSTQAIGANSSRRYLLVQNVSDSDMYVNFGFNPATTNSMLLPKNGGGIVFEQAFVPGDAVQIVCPTGASKPYYLLSAG